MADFSDRDLLFGLTTTGSYLVNSAQDFEFGFNNSRRDGILQTYVRDAYVYHLNKILEAEERVHGLGAPRAEPAQRA
jgi:hypothetical protein